MPATSLFRVSSRRCAPVLVEAANWLSALAQAITEQGSVEGIERMAFERLRNGTVIANDLSQNRRYAVERIEVSFTGLPAQRYLDWMVDGLASIH